MDARTALNQLTHASGRLWRLVKHRDTYDDTMMVFDQFVCLPYDRALADALAAVETALEQAGQVLYEPEADPSSITYDDK